MNFDRDQKFRSGSNFFDRWALWEGFFLRKFCGKFGKEMRFISVSRRGGRNKGGRKQMRANANKRRRGQTQANAEAKTQANVDKRKQTLTPPFIAVFYTPLCNPLIIAPGKVAEILRKVCANFAEICGKFSAMSPSRTTP